MRWRRWLRRLRPGEPEGSPKESSTPTEFAPIGGPARIVESARCQLEVRAGARFPGLKPTDVLTVSIGELGPETVEALAEELYSLVLDDSGMPRTSYEVRFSDSWLAWGASDAWASIVLEVSAGVIAAGIIEAVREIAHRLGSRRNGDAPLTEAQARSHAEHFVDHYFTAGTERRLVSTAQRPGDSVFEFRFKVGRSKISVEVGDVDGQPIIRGKKIRRR